MVFLFLFAVFSACAASPTPLPLMPLINLQGQSVSSTEWEQSGQWLVVYIRPNCRACDTLLHLLRPASAPKLVIIGAMAVSELKSVAAIHADLAGATWLVDNTKQSAAALHISGSPVVFGLRKRNIQWSLNGLLADQVQYLNLVEGWIR